jgi:CheY-like chemotaxis protein
MSQTIFIADDSPTEITVLSNLAKDAGFDVVGAATDGDSAITLAQKSKPDCLIIDVVMPGKNGYQVCRELKKQGSLPACKILLISSASIDDAYARRMGADAVMTKDGIEGKLAEALGTLLN